MTRCENNCSSDGRPTVVEQMLSLNIAQAHTLI
jgi:hypothetical protein